MEKQEERWNEMKREYSNRQMPNMQVIKMKEMIRKAKNENRTERRRHLWKCGAAAAAAAAVLITVLPNTSSDIAYAMSRIPILSKWVEVVTAKSYQYDDARHTADIQMPELVPQIPDETNAEAAKKSANEINAEIKEITVRLINEFQEGLKQQEGYQAMQVTSEVVCATDDFFTLKLVCFQAAGSGYEENHFYTMDLNTGRRLRLKDLFTEGSGFLSVISENIKEQMKEQMAADENVIYNLDSDIPEWDFKEITEDTSFYLNDRQEVVICFNEGEVAPMYMGCVEFTIPNEVLKDLRNN